MHCCGRCCIWKGLWICVKDPWATITRPAWNPLSGQCDSYIIHDGDGQIFLIQTTGDVIQWLRLNSLHWTSTCRISPRHHFGILNASSFKTLEAGAEKTLGLSAEDQQLKKEKKEVETKSSDVEIKVLEHHDSVKKVVDEQEKTLTHLKALEKVLAAAKEVIFAAAKVSWWKEEKYAAILENMKELESQLATAQKIYGTLQNKERSVIIGMDNHRWCHAQTGLYAIPGDDTKLQALLG